jgi:flagellar M-ring protein FliF
MDRLKAMFADAFARIAAWPPQRQIGAALSVVVGVLVFSLLLSWSMHQAYVPLLTNLTEEDAGQIAERLDADHIPYKVASNGSAIMVPEERVHALRLKLAGEGLPKGGNIGFELFDSPNFGMSRFAEQLNYRRGLEGELRRSIRQIEAVQDARVHIVVPEQGLFREQDKQATAAVTLGLRPGRHLGAGQVQAIVHLVASSVAGLAPDQVTIVDNAGNILAKGGESAGNLSQALEQQRAVEAGIEDRVKAILTPIVGQGHVVVRASANLDFSHHDRTTESYDPASKVLRSEQVSQERRTGGSASGGVPGARSNLTGINKAPPAATPGSNERSSATHNYEINKVVAHEVGAQGKLTRLSVAVLVDGVETVDAEGKKTVTERTPEELARFGELVRRAMGFDDDRDDQVTVHSMAFEPAPAPEAPEPEPSVYLNYAERFWPPALAAMVASVVLVSFLRGRKTAQAAQASLNGVLASSAGRTVQEIEQALGRTLGANGGGISAAALQQGLSGASGAAGNFGFVPSGIVPKLAGNLEPKVAAQVIKGWLNED